MKYSIIIPTLNEEKLLPGLLKSLYNPNLKSKFDYEIIVSDGGSMDKTLEIAKCFCDKLLTHSDGEIRTISSGRAKGAQSANGEYLLFINADVQFDIEKLLLTAEEKFIPYDYVAMTCPIKSTPEYENAKDKLFSKFLNIYFYLLNLIGLGMARGECQLIRREVYEKSGGYKEKIVAGEDFELFTRIRKLGRIFFSWEVTVYESPRRYHSWGYLKIIIAWFLNSTSSLLCKKSFFKEWKPIR